MWGAWRRVCRRGCRRALPAMPAGLAGDAGDAGGSCRRVMACPLCPAGAKSPAFLIGHGAFLIGACIPKRKSQNTGSSLVWGSVQAVYPTQAFENKGLWGTVYRARGHGAANKSLLGCTAAMHMVYMWITRSGRGRPRTPP